MTKIPARILLCYSTLFTLVIFIGGLLANPNLQTLFAQAFLFPILLYLFFMVASQFHPLSMRPGLRKLLRGYSFVVVNIMALMGFISAKTGPQILSAGLFFPLATYFWIEVFPKRKRAVVIPRTRQVKPSKLKMMTSPEEGIIEEEFSKEGFSLDRRQFLKLIGSAGMSVFLLSIFTRKAQATFFGSVPGPGTVAIKDIAGDKIDPAEKHPTDGYKISQIDDSSPAYYGFIEKDGDWFIMKETTDGQYRYYKKGALDDDFETEWPNRAGFSYNYYDSIF